MIKHDLWIKYRPEPLFCWVKHCHLHHPPVITHFTCGMFTIPSHEWSMTLFYPHDRVYQWESMDWWSSLIIRQKNDKKKDQCISFMGINDDQQNFDINFFFLASPQPDVFWQAPPGPLPPATPTDHGSSGWAQRTHNSPPGRTYGGWASEILQQLKLVVNQPSLISHVLPPKNPPWEILG